MKDEIKEYIIDFFKCNDVEQAWVLMEELQKKFGISAQEAYSYVYLCRFIGFLKTKV